MTYRRNLLPDFIAIVIVLVAIVCVGFIGVALWANRPVTPGPNHQESREHQL